ncbi:MAG: hypothetical protein NVS4B10_13650 [Myxococcales bacterium]
MSSRVEHLYEISKLFASFDTVAQTFDPALGIAARTLPLRSAILIETEDGRARMIVWPSEGQDSGEMRVGKDHVEAAYAYLVGARPEAALDLREETGATVLPRQLGLSGPTPAEPARRFIVIPLVVARRPPFGALQVEGARALDKEDLAFVNAIANQLAIALDRDRAWRRDILRREFAEEERALAEAKGATAERDRAIAEALRAKYEALASENALLYEQAQQAVRVREQILAVVSHDLRDPLGTILLTAGALAKRESAAERRGELPQAAGIIQRAADRMLRLIGDLLDFASIEAGRLAIQRKPQDAGALIQETLANFQGIANEKKQLLTADVEPDLPEAYCDRDRILQVLSNLAGNATRATTAGGHITLRVGAGDHELVFAVSDDGPGISEVDVKHLFERYWRSGDAKYKGTGLGLSIARGIVNAHGGRIWAESELGRVVEHVDAVGDPDRGADVLLDQQHRDTLLAHVGDDLEHIADDQRREALGRLVEEQQLGVEEQRPRDGEHLLLTAGELAALVGSALLQPREELVNARDGPGPRTLQRDLEVLLHRQVGEDAPALGDIAHAERGHPVGGPADGRLSEDAHRACARRREPHQAAQGGRLARSVAPQQGDDLALPDVERSALQDVALPVEGLQALGLERLHPAFPR